MTPGPQIRVGITLGDVNGIGPEVALKAVYTRRWATGVRFLLIGAADLAMAEARRLGLPAPRVVDDPAAPSTGRCGVWTPPGVIPVRNPGCVRADAGRAAADWIRAAVGAALRGEVDALVTAPICKESLKAAGVPEPGHTEMLARLTRTRRFAMLLVGGGLRVVLATRHLPLRDVPGALSRRGLLDTIRLTAEAMPWLGLPDGVIGVCGLNPHAGDGGALGDEESLIIAPALRAARRAGLRVAGPVPADTIFHQALQGRYAAVVAMYHDQGLGPLKMLGFETGVNVTLGLPIVRTSPDHGTAFDLAGQGRANPSSMREAIRLALALAARPNPWAGARA